MLEYKQKCQKFFRVSFHVFTKQCSVTFQAKLISSSHVSCFQSFQAGHRSKSPGHMFRNSNRVVFLLLLDESRKGPTCWFESVILCVGLLGFFPGAFKKHPSQTWFCREFAAEECHYLRQVVSAASGCGLEGDFLRMQKGDMVFVKVWVGRRDLKRESLTKSAFIPAQSSLLNLLCGFTYLGFCVLLMQPQKLFLGLIRSPKL